MSRRIVPPFSTYNAARPSTRMAISSISWPGLVMTKPVSITRSVPCSTSHSSSRRRTPSKIFSAAMRSTMGSVDLGGGLRPILRHRTGVFFAAIPVQGSAMAQTRTDMPQDDTVKDELLTLEKRYWQAIQHNDLETALDLTD